MASYGCLDSGMDTCTVHFLSWPWRAEIQCWRSWYIRLVKRYSRSQSWTDPKKQNNFVVYSDRESVHTEPNVVFLKQGGGGGRKQWGKGLKPS